LIIALNVAVPILIAKTIFGIVTNASMSGDLFRWAIHGKYKRRMSDEKQF